MSHSRCELRATAAIYTIRIDGHMIGLDILSQLDDAGPDLTPMGRLAIGGEPGFTLLIGADEFGRLATSQIPDCVTVRALRNGRSHDEECERCRAWVEELGPMDGDKFAELCRYIEDLAELPKIITAIPPSPWP